jgi:hypothetical protein
MTDLQEDVRHERFMRRTRNVGLAVALAIVAGFGAILPPESMAVPLEKPVAVDNCGQPHTNCSRRGISERY